MALPHSGWRATASMSDQGLTGTHRERPGLCEALAACREGATLVVTKLDRLARSLPDAGAIADELTAARFVPIPLGESISGRPWSRFSGRTILGI